MDKKTKEMILKAIAEADSLETRSALAIKEYLLEKKGIELTSVECREITEELKKEKNKTDALV